MKKVDSSGLVRWRIGSFFVRFFCPVGVNCPLFTGQVVRFSGRFFVR